MIPALLISEDENAFMIERASRYAVVMFFDPRFNPKVTWVSSGENELSRVDTLRAC